MTASPPTVPRTDWHADATHHVIVARGVVSRDVYLSELPLEVACDRKAVVDWLYGEEENPDDVISVLAFNPIEGWASDVTEDIARGIAERYRSERAQPTWAMRNFIEHHCGLNTVLPALAVEAKPW